MRRLLKQLLYGSFYLLFFIFIFGGFYIGSKAAPSCFDGTQNQGEEGIDCGGICGGFCLPADMRPIEVVGNVRLLFPDRTHVSLLAELRNPNIEFAAKVFNYTVTVYGESGEIAMTIPRTSFIYGGETGRYILIPNIQLPVGGAARATLTVANPSWVPAVAYKRPEFSVKQTETSEDESGVIVRGEVVNRGALGAPRVTVLALFYGEFRQLIGASQTELNNIRRNETRTFEVYHPPLPLPRSETKVFLFPARP